jgi:hypothetical protein
MKSLEKRAETDEIGQKRIGQKNTVVIPDATA